MDDRSLNPPRVQNGLRPLAEADGDVPRCGGIMP